MFKRRKKLIDRRFQLKTTFSIISISILAFLVIIALISIRTAKNNRDISKTIFDLNQAIEVESNIVGAFIDYSKHIQSPDLVLATRKISDDHTRSIGVMRQYVDLLKSFTEQNLQLIIIITVIVLLWGIFLYFYLVRLTHRISGPLFVISRHMADIIEGRDPQFRDLRDKDEFKEFYDRFRQMADKIREYKDRG